MRRKRICNQRFWLYLWGMFLSTHLNMIRNNKPKLNKKKLRNVILYLAQRVPDLTEEKLWCLLYFIDFDFFEKYNRSLTGLTYIRKE